VKQLLKWCKDYEVIHEGDHLLEIGTGWLHWESTLIRLFYDVEITLFDVWDNRQLQACKSRYAQLEKIIDEEFALDAVQQERVHRLLAGILQANSFDDIYRLLNFRHIVNPCGTLTQFTNQSIALVFSSNVLEHVAAKILPEFIQDFYRLLKPGGYSIHQIDLGDHLSYYDGKTSLKNYLRYSDSVWKRYFENDVQYFNRVQRGQWLALYRDAGLELVEEEPIYVDIGPISIDTRFASLDQQDLQCRTLRVVHRRPH
jgi:predicted SAM-dependent methyltransferase